MFTDKHKNRGTNVYTGNSKATVFFAIVLVIGSLIFSQYRDQGTVEAAFGDDCFGVAGTDTSYFVYYQDVQDVRLTGAWKIGNLVEGLQEETVCNGLFFREDIGEYWLYAYLKPGKFIIVRHKNGILVYNCSTAEATIKNYETLIQKLA